METSTWNLLKEHSWFPWTTAILGSLIVGLSGVVPLLFIPKHKSKANSNAKRNLQRQLSFAFGGLLGDVFLHLVPEAYESGMYEEKGFSAHLFFLQLIFGLQLQFIRINNIINHCYKF